MADDECMEAAAVNTHGADVSVSGEHMSLMDFAYQLGSYNFAAEPGIADEGSTRQEAKLLMSLLSCTASLDGTISLSDGEPSYHSDSSLSHKDTFTFICPSLSLERSRTSVEDPDDVGLEPESSGGVLQVTQEAPASETPLPAELLKRTLKVDDRDALRLSADAMARNLLLSYQKAMDWRIQTWIQSLSKIISQKEKEIRGAGASEDDVKALLVSPEAKLMLALQHLSKEIQLLAVMTTYRVLPDLILPTEHIQQPQLKRRKISTEHECRSVTHALILDCKVNLQTPAGYSEIALHVPGTMQGDFRTDSFNEELHAVVIELDTDILAAMIEKGCRKIIRASVEHVLLNNTTEQDKTSQNNDTADSTTTTDNTFVSPRPTEELFRTAIVTPHKRFSNSASPNDSPVLRPIPDDLDDNGYSPSRISPQPHSSEMSNAPLTPRNTAKASPSLISPPPKSEFHEVSGGPSLPMLVEAACRAMRAN